MKAKTKRVKRTAKQPKRRISVDEFCAIVDRDLSAFYGAKTYRRMLRKLSA